VPFNSHYLAGYIRSYVSQNGFKQMSETVEVLLGKLRCQRQAGVGATSETITVTEQGALLQTEDANIASNFDTTDSEYPEPWRRHYVRRQTAPGIAMNSSTGAAMATSVRLVCQARQTSLRSMAMTTTMRS